jgi:sterol desaturase/sphingolipid hydroxylase (fatty acid hydroxylase superfamily)
MIQLRPLNNLLDLVVDFGALFLAMDFAMYIFHRVAHHPLLYPLIHDTHHRFENPRPLTLFVLNPFETLGFGALWLVVISIYHSSFAGMILYLTLNVAFGLMGHLGVEPFPARWLEVPLIRYISTSTFHAEHHQDRHHNYGFYTVIWDRLFGTLSPNYSGEFQSAAARQSTK